MQIIMPDGSKIYFDNNFSYEKKLNLIKQQILDKWNDYFLSNWLQERTVNGYKYNVTKQILNNCAYILTYNTDDVLSRKKEKSIHFRELPITSCNGNEYFYASDDNNEVTIQTKNDKIPPKHGERYFHKGSKLFKHLQGLSDNLLFDVRFSTLSHYNKCQHFLYKVKDIDSLLCLTINKHYYTPEVEKHFSVFYNEVLHTYMRLKCDFKIPTKQLQDKNKLLHLAKYEYMHLLTRLDKIELIRKYLIDASLPYSAEWVNVDLDDEFSYDDKQFRISGGYGFDKLLVYTQNGKLLFFDNDVKLLQHVIKC